MTEKVQTHPAQERLAGIFSSINLLGPPMSDRLLRLVAHLFTPQEAEIAEHIAPYVPMSLATIANRAKRELGEVSPLVQSMAERRVIFSISDRYCLIPLIPGMFEYVLMDGRDDEWHRKYAELLIDLTDTGYFNRYNRYRVPAFRNIPIETAIGDNRRAVGSDRVTEMIESHSQMAVANVCQCRQTKRFLGKSCQRASHQDGCLFFGEALSSWVESTGSGRLVDEQQMRDIVADRYEKNLVFMTGNVSPEKANIICTCCDCCCQGLKLINDFDGKVLVADSHFLASVDQDRCNDCGECSRVCNTHAHRWEGEEHCYDASRCLGCGLCAEVCEQQAISLVENSAFRPPARGFSELGVKLLPNVIRSGLKARIAR